MLAVMNRMLTLLDRGRPATGTAAAQRGLRGERAAYFFLRRQGYVVVARRCRHALLDGEIDLIGWEGETLCMIEVKTRSSRTPFAAEFRIDKSKVATMRRMADAYMKQMPWPSTDGPVITPRFDALSVYLDASGEADLRLQRDFFR